MSSKKLIVVALALVGALGAGVAQARRVDDVQWSVTIGTPVYAQPAPVYAPAYPTVYQQHHHYAQPTRWDRDGDGVPNRYDHLYNPSWDRDGDGVPNRYDRYDNRRYDRDGDGIPNGQDRYDGRYGGRGR